MASKNGICSMATSLLGCNRPANFDEPTTEEDRLSVLWWGQCVGELLEAHDWKFARKRSSTLAAVATPNDEYAYAYQLPTDCVMVRYVWDEDAAERVTDSEYEIHGQMILTNIEDDIAVVYTKLDENVGKYPAYFVKCLIYLLASCMSYKLAEKLQDSMEARYDKALLRAINRDQSQNNYPVDTNQDTWLTAAGFSETTVDTADEGDDE